MRFPTIDGVAQSAPDHRGDWHVGGAPPHALARAAHFADGWMPMGTDPEQLRAPIAALRARFAERARPAPAVVAMGPLPLADPPRARAQLAALTEIGVTALVHGGGRYEDAAFARSAEALAALRG